MEISSYGITLREVSENDLELLRTWRNSEEISKYMLSKEYISQEMQQNWYRSFKARGDMNFVICFEGRDIGFFGLKVVDKDNNRYNPGIYFSETEGQNSFLPYLVHLCFIEYIYKKNPDMVLVTQILRINKRALRFSLSCGYQKTRDVQDEDTVEVTLTREKGVLAAEKLKNVLGLSTE